MERQQEPALIERTTQTEAGTISSSDDSANRGIRAYRVVVIRDGEFLQSTPLNSTATFSAGTAPR